MKEAEWLTRKKRIDSKLRSPNAKWQIVRFREGLDCMKLEGHTVEVYPTANGFADYALFVRGKLLGVIEAKKVTVSPQNVLEQAKRYSHDVAQGVGNWDGYRIPFLYATLEAHYRTAKAHVDKLTQAILAKAFRGELVPTEAELAHQEGRNYEPASALLEKNRRERAGQTQSSKVARSKKKKDEETRKMFA